MEENKLSEHAEDRLLRMMADQSQEVESLRVGLSARVAALEKRPRRSLLDLDVESLASTALIIFAGLILTRLLFYIVAQMKKGSVSNDNP
jgi:hypothetical protein